MLAHQAEWGLLSRRDGILDRSRNGQVRRSSREARRQRDDGHGQQESMPQRLAPARGLRGWPAVVIAGGPDQRVAQQQSAAQPQRRAGCERATATTCTGRRAVAHSACKSFPPPLLHAVLCCAPAAVRTSCSPRRRSAAAGAAQGAPQSRRNQISRPSNRIKNNNNHSHNQMDMTQEFNQSKCVWWCVVTTWWTRSVLLHGRAQREENFTV
jgi:hypothetical protein